MGNSKENKRKRNPLYVDLDITKDRIATLDHPFLDNEEFNTLLNKNGIRHKLNHVLVFVMEKESDRKLLYKTFVLLSKFRKDILYTEEEY